jgi:hypothetical protein
LPYDFSTFTLPGGAGALRANASGDIGKDDVAYFLEHAGPGKPMSHLPLLITSHGLTSLSTEARSFMTANVGATSELTWCAMVVSNPVIRVAINFMMRVKQHPRLRMFGQEADAIRWLDERVLEEQARKAM